MKIITQQINPPIPMTKFDWCAVFDNYEPADPQGWGETQDQAIEDLMEQQFKGEIA